MAREKLQKLKEEKREAAAELTDEKKEGNVLLTVKKPVTYAEELTYNAELINQSVVTKDPRHMTRAMRNLHSVRRKTTAATAPTFCKFVEVVLAGSSLVDLTNKFFSGQTDMEATFDQQPFLKSLPDIELFYSCLMLMHLIDQNRLKESLELSTILLQKLKEMKRRSAGQISAKLWFMISWAFELNDRLVDLRPELLTTYRTACLHHDAVGQATLMNLILRNYLHFHLYELANKFISKTSFPEGLRSNSQLARFLYYHGRIKAVQLEYSEAHRMLLQAVRKAPQHPKIALGFRLIAQKLAVVVELLMGDIPERQIFNVPEFREPLAPYRELVQVVRLGDLGGFQALIAKESAGFEADKTLSLIGRLHHNVIKTGLRTLNVSYSRIGLADVAKKLSLESAADAEGIVSKAILDGVIEATIDRENQFVQSKSTIDVYSTQEPMKAFHKRISFGLAMHAEAVKAMAFPEEGEKTEEQREEEEAEKRKQRQEMIARAEEEDDDEDMI
uniref:PCI domain-containing protein n=1 Tax=Chromera velia CCMP2878 TaxID=1169474 RepID=A0A0G4GMB0_9ALVE|mmetsp:Transcript_24894/g.48747  ORF Transcript_24894/g.48747 Transcript_24894/m.48747 type:complete len:503 (-) Transcript_24894:434-1942(-)|eukprot:Cvel_22534.t1-p1 / transcript=Cvel_22534.t1 / gene=Cvel_22534 / organism=Chromera_velia_CCMP2878 / gene_product=Probable 26S proteasome non-ATPase regulatory, putative / transcript_product=Probable 26S proteasome non-ATPase regulatory, putative / location=Cvel_scaffold2224:19611-26588(-) / protein_length=502 / sequence_SO=supercontig / SO=protein_coding / is_pseudo=false